MEKISRKIIIFLILIVLFAMTLRITRAIQEQRYSNDTYLYFEMAEKWAYNGNDYMQFTHNNIPPLLPWIMAMGYNLGLTPEYTGLIAGILLGSLMPLAAFWIALNLFSHTKLIQTETSAEKYALLAAFLVAVHPFLVRISVSCLREILYLPLIAFATAFAISAIYNKSLWKWCSFAFIATLANMARREGIIIIAVFFVWQLLEFILDRKSFTSNIKYNILTSFAVVIVFSGFTILLTYMLRSSSSIWSPFIY